MARNDDSDLRYDRRGMLWRMGASGIAVAVPACGGDKEEPGSNVDTSTPGTSDSGTASGATSTAPGASSTPAAPEMSTPASTTSPAATPTTDTDPPAATTSEAPAQMTSAPSASESPDPDPTPSESSDPPPEDTAPEGTGGSGGGEPEPEMGGGGSGGSTNPPTSGDLIPPDSWEDVPMCTASPSDPAGQGPFFIHNDEKDDDVDMFRQDIRGQYNPDAEEGIEMHIHLRILNSTSDSCAMTPVPDLDVYIWHTDAQGYYSGFGNPGDQTPDVPYGGTPGANDLFMTDRFCRGAQVTDANGVVSFKSIFPGWYNGRDVHIHFVALRQGSMSLGRTNDAYRNLGPLTTQLYFDREFTDSVHKSAEPYKRRTEGDLADYYAGAIDISSPGNSGLVIKARMEGSIVLAQIQILLDPEAMGSPAAPGGGGGFGGF